MFWPAPSAAPPCAVMGGGGGVLNDYLQSYILSYCLHTIWKTGGRRVLQLLAVELPHLPVSGVSMSDANTHRPWVKSVAARVPNRTKAQAQAHAHIHALRARVPMVQMGIHTPTHTHYQGT
jgi:hypothetical protein